VRPLETTNKFFIKIKEIYGEMNSEW
jgi:hypothetical protein